jgi:hypothetical protein
MTASPSGCHGDMLTHPFEQGSFDTVVSNAALHHLSDSKAALHHPSELARPGGTLAIVGFARMQMRDCPWAVTSFVALGLANRVQRNGSTPRHRPGHRRRRSSSCAGTPTRPCPVPASSAYS